MEVPPSLAPVLGPTTFVILTLSGILAMVVRSLFKRHIIPASHHDEIMETVKAAITERDETIRELKRDRDGWRNLAERLEAQNAELLTNQDFTLNAWNAIKAYVSAKESES